MPRIPERTINVKNLSFAKKYIKQLKEEKHKAIGVGLGLIERMKPTGFGVSKANMIKAKEILTELLNSSPPKIET